MSELALGFGFQYPDLFDALRLAELTQTFDRFLQERDESAFKALSEYRAAKGRLPAVKASEAIVGAASHVGAFVAELFGVQFEREGGLVATARESVLFAFKKEVVKKRVMKRPPETDVKPSWIELLDGLGVPREARGDESVVVPTLWPAFQSLDRVSRSLLKGGTPPTETDLELARTAEGLLADRGHALSDITGESPIARAERALSLWLEPAERYLALWHRDHEALHGHGGHPHPWVSLRLPRKLEFEHLVELRRPNANMPELAIGPEAHLRHRDGFSLTDSRMTPREVLSEVDYCLLCQERDKDSCSKGFREKSGGFKPIPIGVPTA